jgi:hypothetical protein
MIAMLLATLLAGPPGGVAQRGTPEVAIADEHRPGGDPTEVKITLTNATDMVIHISFRPNYHARYFEFRLSDLAGRPLALPVSDDESDGGSRRLMRLLRGESATGYLSPRHCFKIPPGRYQVSVIYRYRPYGKDVEQAVESNRIVKDFPMAESPRVVIADEHRPDGDPAEIKVTVLNREQDPVYLNFEPYWQAYSFGFHLHDDEGRPARLARADRPEDTRGPVRWVRVLPGATATGYLSPRVEYKIPPGRYQLEVAFFYRVPGKTGRQEVRSNRITKTFP